MEKLGLIFRETLENRIKGYVKDSSSIFIISYAKLSSPDITALRQSLKSIKSTLFVAKNTVARRALKGSGLEDLVKFVEGPCGLVFTKEEPVDTTRVLCNFSKEREQLILRGGFLEDRIIEKKDIETLARLPSKDVLRAQVVITLKSPISGLAIVLNQVLRKFVYCLEQIKNKKETTGESEKIKQ
ncbi:MAG: 50S ribosomal protein L10 [Candidatus Omnitrophica bacterium]|nr:50S ribosomal protein L10 [Candidatus Omnitrophota bacterium]